MAAIGYGVPYRALANLLFDDALARSGVLHDCEVCVGKHESGTEVGEQRDAAGRVSVRSRRTVGLSRCCRRCGLRRRWPLPVPLNARTPGSPAPPLRPRSSPGRIKPGPISPRPASVLQPLKIVHAAANRQAHAGCRGNNGRIIPFARDRRCVSRSGSSRSGSRLLRNRRLQTHTTSKFVLVSPSAVVRLANWVTPPAVFPFESKDS